MENIKITHGNLLNSQVEALVNTVNCVGVMGKGIALQFDNKFPQNTLVYKAACKAKTLRPGELLVVNLQLEIESQLPRFIINFATKDHWRAPSQLEWIEKGLKLLAAEVVLRGITSIAIPPLGCGAGGLNWDDVRPLIINAFAALPDVEVLVFPPEGAPDIATMAPSIKPPTMNANAAMTIDLLARYSIVDLEFSQLELQKLIYLLQAAGEPLSKVHFEKMKYGPAARELFPMLRRWENHWTIGFGDGTGGIREPVLLKPEIVDFAHKYLGDHPAPASQRHVEKVIQLIEGLDTALGLELLASVHWVARNYPEASRHVEEATLRIHEWNEHKKDSFSEEHIRVAWNRLASQGWLQNLRPEWMRPFRCDHVEQVTTWVNKHPGLDDLLPQAAKEVGKLFPKATLWLELWSNPEAGRDELSLQIDSHLSLAQRTAKLQELDRTWWLEHAADWQGVFSIDLV